MTIDVFRIYISLRLARIPYHVSRIANRVSYRKSCIFTPQNVAAYDYS